MELIIANNNGWRSQEWPYQTTKTGGGAINSRNVYLTAHNNSFNKRLGFVNIMTGGGHSLCHSTGNSGREFMNGFWKGLKSEVQVGLVWCVCFMLLAKASFTLCRGVHFSFLSSQNYWKISLQKQFATFFNEIEKYLIQIHSK